MLRNCLGCGQIDDAPRDIVHLGDGTEVFWHMDCHARANPPCEVCAATVESAQGKQNDDLRAHIEEGGAADAVAVVLDNREQEVLAQYAAQASVQDQEG